MVSPRNLLNRWILLLEERQDYLTLSTGKRIAVPFEELVLFSTNLEPRQLADVAFPPRIRHKILIYSPDRASFSNIFKNVYSDLGMSYQPEFVDYLYNRYYAAGRETRSSDPRDLLEIVESICRFRGTERELGEELVGLAAERFFGSP